MKSCIYCDDNSRVKPKLPKEAVPNQSNYDVDAYINKGQLQCFISKASEKGYGDAKYVTIRTFPINFCSVCGRKLRNKTRNVIESKNEV